MKWSKRPLLVFLSPRRKGFREDDLSHWIIVNLDFDARVPIPVSVFPSSYRGDVVNTTTTTHVEAEVKLPEQPQRVGREGYSSFSANLPPRDEFRQEEVHITREDRHRPSRREDIYIREETRPEYKHSTAHIDINLPSKHKHYDVQVDTSIPNRRQYDSQIDLIERQYRSRFQPTYREEVDIQTTVDPPRFVPAKQEHIHITEETVDPPRFKSNKMGYYDDDGHYHSVRHGLHKAADHVKHDIREAADHVLGRHHHHHHHRPHSHVGTKTEIVDIAPAPAPSRVSVSEPASVPNTVTIPTHHIRLGDLLILQGRPCQVIRISTSSSTGQHRYLGVDLFTKQLHEESSFISNPSPSVIVQTMLGPVFKQYRVLDLQDGTVVAMTETGDVKQALPVIDQSNLWARLNEAFDTGRGSVRALVISDHGRELVVDMKVVHGSRL
ncbi:hypothetical protein B0O99DRAFT_676540 [Bisporella sp. PMI_857]|nr:hypothetical protein B0O99DRAFT_676540 [Bisporella sp. PMI_857]